jgi:hypothetical protein
MTVIVPSTAFDLVPLTWVHDGEALTQHLAVLPDSDLFQRLQANSQHAEGLRTRHLMWLPPKYAPLLLDNKGYTPRQAYLVLHQAFQDDGILPDVAPILAWLRITLHASTANNGSPKTAITLTAPFLDVDLLIHRAPLLQAALPGRHDTPAGLESAIAGMASAVVQQTHEARTARLARDIERDQPTTPTVKFGALFESLKAYLFITQEQQLPEIWFQLAAASKRQEFGVLREYLEAYARCPTAFIPLAPVATPKLLSDLTSVTFCSEHHDDIKSGLHPFIAMDGSEEHRAAGLELARSFNLIYERDFGMAYSDLDKFKLPKDLRSYPLSFFDLEQNLGIFGNLIAAVLGEPHPLVLSYRQFWTAFSLQFRLLLQHEMDIRKVIKPVHILRNIQLVCYTWFSARRSRLEPPPPQFLDILHRLSLGIYTTPHLPPLLYQLVTPPRLSTGKNPGAYFFSGKTLPGQTDDASSASTALSTITGDTMRTPLTTRSGTFVPNNNPVFAIQSLVRPDQKIRNLIGSVPPPLNDDNETMCLSFHVKGGCYSNCRRKSDHDRALTAGEQQRLATYVADRLAALEAAKASGATPP